MIKTVQSTSIAAPEPQAHLEHSSLPSPYQSTSIGAPDAQPRVHVELHCRIGMDMGPVVAGLSLTHTCTLSYFLSPSIASSFARHDSAFLS